MDVEGEITKLWERVAALENAPKGSTNEDMAAVKTALGNAGHPIDAAAGNTEGNTEPVAAEKSAAE